MNLRRIQYHCSCGSCDECTGGNAKSYFDGMTPVPNIEQIIPIEGPAGKASLTIASVTDGTTDSAGTDVAMGDSTIADLATLGYDVTTKPTLKVTPDPSDLNNTKVFIRESNAFLNFLASFKTKLLPSGSEGNILKYVSGLWTSAAPDWEKYNCTTTTDLSYTIADVGTTKNFTVPSGMSYRFKNAVAIASPADPLNNYLEGVVVAYSGVILSIVIKNIKGTGGTVNWNVMLTAPEYLPYFDATTNNGMFLKNINGSLGFSISALSTGFTLPWHNEAYPEGFIPCDGVTFLKTEYPDLYQHLRPNGIVNKYAFALDGTTPLGIGSCRTPGYNNGTIPYGVSSGSDLGVRFGENILSGGIPVINLPVTSPYGISVSGSGIKAPPAGPPTYSVATGTDHTVYDVADYAVNVATPKTNNISGGQVANGGQDLDIRQSSEGCFYIIKT